MHRPFLTTVSVKNEDGGEVRLEYAVSATSTLEAKAEIEGAFLISKCLATRTSSDVSGRRVVVTGGTGFVGANLVRALLGGEPAWSPEPVPELAGPINRLRVIGSVWTGPELLAGALLLRSARRTREALRDERRPGLVRAVLDGMGDLVIVLDYRNRVVDLNQAAAYNLGVAAGAAIGQPAGQVLHAYAALVEYYGGVNEIQTQITLNTPDGAHYFELRIAPLGAPTRPVAGRLIVLFDREQNLVGRAPFQS